MDGDPYRKMKLDILELASAGFKQLIAEHREKGMPKAELVAVLQGVIDDVDAQFRGKVDDEMLDRMIADIKSSVEASN